MSFWVRFVSLSISCLLIIYIIRTIRTKKMREEYIVLWLFTASGTVILVFFDNFSIWLARLIGAENDIVMISFLSFAYVLALLVHYSLRISETIHNIKELNQEIALLRNEIGELKNTNGHK